MVVTVLVLEKIQLKIKELSIILNNKCNLNCEYCFENNYNKNNKEISENIINYIVKFIDYNVKDKLEINLIGGEPLLSYNKILYILNILKQKDYKNNLIIKLFTNGTIYNKHILKELNNFKYNIIITKDSYPDLQYKSGYYNQINENIEKFKKYTNNIFIYHLLTKKTIDKLENILQYKIDNNELNIPFNLEYLKNKDNISYKDFNKIITAINNIYQKNNLSPFQKSEIERMFNNIHIFSDYKQYMYDLTLKSKCKCEGGIKQFYIRYDGVILPCDRLLGNDYLKKQQLPNIKDIIDNNINIYDYDIFKFLKNNNIEKSELGYNCNECIFKFTCETCRIESYIQDKENLIYHSKEKCNRTLDKNNALLDFYIKNIENEINTRIDFKKTLFNLYAERMNTLL